MPTEVLEVDAASEVAVDDADVPVDAAPEDADDDASPSLVASADDGDESHRFTDPDL
jgi:hypothetical protein